MSIPVEPDMSVFGKLSRFSTQVTFRERSEILGTCFGGLGMFNCVSEEQGYDPNSYNTPYYNYINELKGQVYCTQCCGSDPDLIDEWNMWCPVSAEWETALQSVVYIGAEFRFARKETLGDLEYVSCPLKSNACTYDPDTDETLECDVNYADIEYVIGYELDLRVQQHQENWKYWRGVSSCTATAISRSTPLAEGEWFQEKMFINRKYNFQDMDLYKALIIIVLIGFIWLWGCYFCRRDTCLVCQNRLILFFNRCWICRLFGAHVPDPILLAALATKGERIQMESERPERCPGAKCCTGCVRCLWRWINCRCCQKSKIGAYDETKDLTHILDPDPEPPPTTCCRGNDPDTPSVFEVSCCCLVSCYNCCCKKKGGKVKKIKVVELPLQPYQIYTAIDHPEPPPEVTEAKLKAVVEAQMREDLELYGDLTAKINAAEEPKEGTDAYRAKRRMTTFKESQKTGTFRSDDLPMLLSGSARRGSSLGAPAPSIRRKQASFSGLLENGPGSPGMSRTTSNSILALNSGSGKPPSGMPSPMVSPLASPGGASVDKPSFFRSFSSHSQAEV